MSYMDISIISSRGRGMTLNLSCVRKYLAQRNKNISFHYFITKENTSNIMKKKGVLLNKKDFCLKASNIICDDASLSGNLSFPEGVNRHLMILTPYDYLFETFFRYKNQQSADLRPTFLNFTHIMVSSPFTLEILKKYYISEHLEIIPGTLLPFSYELTQAENIKKIKSKLFKRYPELAGKKIISILVNQDTISETSFFDGFDIKDFLTTLDDKYFIFTNSTKFMSLSGILDSSFRSRFCYIDQIFQPYKMLFFSDVLLTNESTYAAAFAARRLPVYSLSYKNKYFENYMAEMYPKIHLQSARDLFDLSASDFVFTDTHSDFCNHFSYAAQSSTPYAAIEDIFVADLPRSP